MNKYTEHYEPDKKKSSVERLDDVLNHVRGQIDYLCRSAEYQNNALCLLVNGKNEGEEVEKDNMKTEAIELLNKIDNERVLWMVLGTLKAGYAEQEAVRNGVIDGL